MIINTQDYNVYLNVNDDINVIFKSIGDADFNLLEKALSEIKINDHQSVIMIWAAVGRFYGDAESINLINNFYQNIKNPVVLFSGSLSVNQNLNIVHQPIDIFRHITKIEQSQERIVSFNKPKKFLYTTTKNYFSRAYILQHLINNNLVDQGIVSYKCLNDPRYIENYLNVKSITDACDSITHLLPFGGLDNDSHLCHLTKPEYAINDSYLSIITETYYNGPLFLSEKIYYAMTYNHFFIYAGPANTLKYLRECGFKTFSHIINEDYDNILDPVERLKATVASLNEFLSKPIEEIERLYAENVEILNHNRKLVLQTEINDIINSALYKAIDQRNNI